MKIALIGAGRMANAHISGLLPHGDVGIYALENSDAFCEKHGIKKFNTLDEILQWADIVDICTPTDTHYEIAKNALNAGVHVICEKPLCRDSVDAKDLITTARNNGVKLFPAHVVRFFPSYVRLKNAVDEGKLGQLATLRFTRSGTFPSWSRWFEDESRSGGLVMDLMIHDFDQAVWLAGPVREIFASQVERQTVDTKIAAAHCILTHEGGALSHIRGLWGALETQFCTSYHVAGDKGFMSYDSFNDPFVTLNGTDRESAHVVPLSTGDDPYALQIAEFVSAIQENGSPRVTSQDGAHAVELAEAAIKSITTGRPIRI
ncbi:MAG: Gfo/Idh/MocA family oxidoreductase [Actinomycetaceae bacterium]|nr:Gfo/Idh/MocA family oxidoreductase [Actinomycetaceae bacterium]